MKRMDTGGYGTFSNRTTVNPKGEWNVPWPGIRGLRRQTITLPSRTMSQKGSVDTLKRHFPVLEASAASSSGVNDFSTIAVRRSWSGVPAGTSLVSRKIRNVGDSSSAVWSTMTYPRGDLELVDHLRPVHR